VDSQPKTQRSGRGKTKYKYTVSNPNYSTGLGWKWGKRGRVPPFIGETLISPPMAARPRRPVAARRVSTRVCADVWSWAHADPRPRRRTAVSVRTRFLLRPRVNADMGGRPDDVRGRPDGHFHPKTSVMTSLFLTHSFHTFFITEWFGS
jgi:hypothetical protein